MAAPYLQTLGNGIKVLDGLKAGPADAGDLVESTGLARVTIYRILRTLEAEGMVVRLQDETKFQLSPKVWELGQAAVVGARTHPETRHQVDGLRQLWGDTVHVSVYDVGEVLYVYKVDGTTPLRAYTTLGGRAPATAVASGKALLAFQPAEEVERVLSGPLVGYTDLSVVSPATLASELDEIRHSLIAYNRGEWRPGIGGVATPVLTPSGAAVAAVSISGFADRILDDDLPLRAKNVLQAARSIALGLAPDGQAERLEELYADPAGAIPAMERA